MCRVDVYFRALLSVAASVLMACPARAQGYVNYDSVGETRLMDDTGNSYGSGGMQVVSGGYSIPISYQRNDRGQVRSWSANVSASYAKLDNYGEAKALNPDEVLDAGISLMYLTPISNHWSLMTMVGAGVYAPVNDISAESILGSGGVVFIRKMSNTINLGVGVGVTNSYGPPMVMPMLYFSWQQSGRFNLKVDMSTGIKVSASTQLNKWFGLELAAIDMDGMSAVMKVDGKSKIYSMLNMRSYLCPTIRLDKHLSVYGSVGGNWLRAISIRDRSLKAFFNSLAEENNDPYFRTALRLSIGTRYRF